MKKILIIEDDPAILKGLEIALGQEHYETVTAVDGADGHRQAKRIGPDLILLDLMLPVKNGQEVCKELRADGFRAPIIMLTSKNEESDKILGLELGADDYVTKPFSIRELVARIKAQFRRKEMEQNEVSELLFDDVSLNFKKQDATKGGKPIELSAREYQILKFFAEHEGEVISRNTLLDEVWGYENFPTTRTVDNFILSIRKKIETDAAKPRHLITIHTSGYKFVR